MVPSHAAVLFPPSPVASISSNRILTFGGSSGHAHSIMCTRAVSFGAEVYIVILLVCQCVRQCAIRDWLH